MKNFSSFIIFSVPFIIIFVERKNFKQKPVQCPINLPPNNTICLGKKNEGKKIIEIIIIPVKKNNENIKFLNILSKARLFLCAFVFF